MAGTLKPEDNVYIACIFSPIPLGETIGVAERRARKIIADLFPVCDLAVYMANKGVEPAMLNGEARFFGMTRCYYGELDAKTGVISPLELPEFPDAMRTKRGPQS